MDQSNEGDSLAYMSDDALFGSGPALWNSNLESLLGHSNHMDNRVIYNRLHNGTENGHTSNGLAEDVRYRSADRNREASTNPMGARPKVNNTARQEQLVNTDKEFTRNKTIKDKENKNKNCSRKKSTNQEQNDLLRNYSSNNSDFQPTLRLVDYGNNQTKTRNSVKRKKQAMNQNAILVQDTQEDQACANDLSIEPDEYPNLPLELDQNADPSQIQCLYIRRNRPGHVIPLSTCPELETEGNNSLSVNVGQREEKTDMAVKRIHNNLWGNSKNCNVTETSNVRNGADVSLSSCRNDVETDSDIPALACADLPGLSHLQANSRVGPGQIVQQFPDNHISNDLNGHTDLQNMTGVSDSQITVPYGSHTEMSVNLNSLLQPHTDLLFGEGGDYYIAQQLQEEFDKENTLIQNQRQYDHFSNSDYLNLSPDQRRAIDRPMVSSIAPVLNDVYDPDSLGDSLFMTGMNGEAHGISESTQDVPYDQPSYRDNSLSHQSNGHCLRIRGPSLDEQLARELHEQLLMEDDENLARQLQEQDDLDERIYRYGNYGNRAASEPLHTRYRNTWFRPLTVSTINARNPNVMDSSSTRGQSSTERPLTRRHPLDTNEFEYLENIHSPGQMGQYEVNPDFIFDDYGEESLVSITRDPRMLATLLMERAPDMMVPNEIDLNDYEALWELAEGLGEVKRVGMEQSEIDMLPVHIYQGSTGSEDNKTDCLVCLNEFKKGEALRTLPCCHIYHIDCIDEWLKRNAICPVCRQPANHRE